jgi:hypothetical protein
MPRRASTVVSALALAGAAGCDAVLGNLSDRSVLAPDGGASPLLLDAGRPEASGSSSGGPRDASGEADAGTALTTYDAGLGDGAAILPTTATPLAGIAIAADTSSVYFTSKEGSLYTVGSSLSATIDRLMDCGMMLEPGLVFWPPGSSAAYAVASEGKLVGLGGCSTAPMPGYYGGAPWLLAEVAAGTTELFWGTLGGPVEVGVFPALQGPGMFDDASGDIASLAFDESRTALWYGTTTGLFYECLVGPGKTCDQRGSFGSGSSPPADVSSFLAVGGTLFLGTQGGLFVIPAMATMATPLQGTGGARIGVLAADRAGVNVYWSQTTPEAPMFITGVFTCPAAACTSATYVGQGPTDEDVLQIAANEAAVYWITSSAILGFGRP